MYNPKIYIRDYGTPTRRLLAFSGGYDFDLFNVDLKRALIIHAENPVVGEEFLLVSGNQQSGNDVLDLSGVGNDLLVLTTDGALRFFGSDIDLLYSSSSDFPSWAYAFTFNDADLRRSLIMSAAVGSFSVSGGDSQLLRGVVVAADPATFTMTSIDASFRLGNILTADPAAYDLTGFDAGLVRILPMPADPTTFALAGADAGLIRALTMTADASAYVMNFRAATISTDSFEFVSGDQQTGSDASLLSGDQQSGSDILLIK